MNARMRVPRRSSSVAVSLLVAASFMAVGAHPAAADATVHFRNGRAVAVRDYWYAGDRLMFSRGRGIVGVPRAFVTRIETSAAPNIGSAPRGVNAVGAVPGQVDPTVIPSGDAAVARGLSPSSRSVTVLRDMPSKDELYDRAIDLVADGNLDEAIAVYQQAIALDPTFSDAIHGLAMAYADKGMFDQAIEYGRKLVELTPDDTLAHTSLSMFYQRKGMIPEAEAEGAKARVLDWKRQLAEQPAGENKKDGSGS
jgi:tetratricopeptide (TPR) repeat protein